MFLLAIVGVYMMKYKPGALGGLPQAHRLIPQEGSGALVTEVCLLLNKACLRVSLYDFHRLFFPNLPT